MNGWDGSQAGRHKTFCQQHLLSTSTTDYAWPLFSIATHIERLNLYQRKDILRSTWKKLKHTSSRISLGSVSAFRNCQQLQVPLLMVSLASLFCLLGVMGNDAPVGLFLMVDQLDKHWLRAAFRSNDKSLPPAYCE